MRDLDRITASHSVKLDRQKVSVILAAGIVAGLAIFVVGLYIGRRKPEDAGRKARDPLDDLIAKGGAEAAEGMELVAPPETLSFHEVLGKPSDPGVTPPLVPAAEDVDSPMPVDAGSGQAGATLLAGWDETFKVPAMPGIAAYSEPARIALPKPGEKGVFTIHVNSFSDKDEAAGYVTQLRKAGYKAFLVQASTEDRGVLWRVRIGPFFSHKEAWKFAQAFEQKEGIPTYIVQRIVQA